MSRFHIVTLVLVLSILNISAHGGEPVVDEQQGLTLEQIALISLGGAIAMLLILYFVIGIKQPRLILLMLGAAVIGLLIDFIYQKYYILP